MTYTASVAEIMIVVWLSVLLAVLAAQFISFIKDFIGDLKTLSSINLELCNEAFGVV